MSETTVEESDPFHKQEIEEIKQELLSILANVESVTEAMSRAVLKEEDRREQFRTLCSLIDH